MNLNWPGPRRCSLFAGVCLDAVKSRRRPVEWYSLWTVYMVQFFILSVHQRFIEPLKPKEVVRFLYGAFELILIWIWGSLWSHLVSDNTFKGILFNSVSSIHNYHCLFPAHISNRWKPLEWSFHCAPPTSHCCSAVHASVKHQPASTQWPVCTFAVCNSMSVPACNCWDGQWLLLTSDVSCTTQSPVGLLTADSGRTDMRRTTVGSFQPALSTIITTSYFLRN